MKKIALLALPAILLLSCSDDSIVELNKTSNENPQAVMEGMQRIKVASRAEINYLIEKLENSENNPLTRSGALPDVQMSDNEELFVSLVEANRRKVMESLTPAQLDSIRNDEDELEFCPNDSVIACIRFAQLLNAAREIQVSDTVYKYTSKGVAYTKEEFASELNLVDENTKDLVLTEDNVGQPMRISQNVTFIPVDYASTNIKPVTDINGGFTGWTTDETIPNIINGDIILSNGYSIPNKDIRDVNYADDGDGSWLHNVITDIPGKNIVAVNKFSNRKRLYLNFYDQNYIIYSNIGTELKMQKRVCGIWWNIKADELVLGWQTIINKHTMPDPVLDMIPATSHNKKGEYPGGIKYPFPFENEDKLLLHIPFLDYNFTTKDLNKAFNAGLKLAVSKATTYFKNEADKNKENLGLYSAKGREFYAMVGPGSISNKGKKTIEKRFFSKWFPCSYEFQFAYDGHLRFTKAKINKDDHIELYRGIVYGAIKYNGRWLAARITKDSDDK